MKRKPLELVTYLFNRIWFALDLPEWGVAKEIRGFHRWMLNRLEAMQKDTEAMIADMASRQPVYDAIYARALNHLRLTVSEEQTDDPGPIEVVRLIQER